MEPLVRDGDVVEVVPVVSAPGPAPGDVVLAGRSADELVCHRVLAQDGDRYLLAGDRPLALDSVDRSAIHGVVRRVIREGRVLELRDRASRPLDRWLLALHPWCAERSETVIGRLANRLRQGLLQVRNNW